MGIGRVHNAVFEFIVQSRAFAVEVHANFARVAVAGRLPLTLDACAEVSSVDSLLPQRALTSI